jgi:hypothetical protein
MLRGSGELVSVTKSRLLAPVALVAVALGLAACNKSSPPPSNAAATPTVTTSGGTATPTNPVPTTTPPQLIEFTTDGPGPYALGRTLPQLQQGAPGVDDVGPYEECPGYTKARGVGVWHDVELFFKPDGRLYLAINRSLSIPTPSGAYLGTTLADKGSQKGLRSIYASVTTKFELPNSSNPTAFLVQTLDGGGILFELNEGDEVTAMYTAAANYLRVTYTAGGPWC